MPDLVWVLRDFTLDLIDQEGNTMTPDAYLEESLSSHTHPQMVDGLREMFLQRGVHTMPHPNNNGASDTVEGDQNVSGREAFMHSLNTLSQRVNGFSPKLRGGHAFTGSDVVFHLEALREAINLDNAVPDVSSVWDNIMSNAKSEARMAATHSCMAEANVHTGLLVAFDAYRDGTYQETPSAVEVQSLVLSLFKKDTQLVDAQQ